MTQKSWEMEWERTLKAAKKEGKVVMYNTRSPELVQALRESFTGKYGISLEAISGRGASLHEKIVMEYRADVTGADVYFPGTTGLINVLKPAGVVDPIEPELIFPDVTDPQEIKKVWMGGRLDWVDREHLGLGFLSSPNVPFTINTDLVKPEELKSYQDLLNPKWRGKIIIDDPTQPGGGLKWFGIVGEVIMGWDYLRELVKQKPTLTRDHRLMTEWLARGKYAIAISIQGDIVKEFQKVGSPLKFLTPKEGTYRTAGGGILVLPKSRPHPNAARVFVNWILGKESGVIWTKMYRASNRLDISKEGLDPLELFQPDVEYVNSETEEWAKKAVEHMVKAREIFAGLLE